MCAVVRDACRAVSTSGADATTTELKARGVEFVTSTDVPSILLRARSDSAGQDADGADKTAVAAA